MSSQEELSFNSHTMKKCILIVLAIVVINSSCKNDTSYKYSLVYSTDIDNPDYDFKAINFLNKDTGFLAGSVNTVQTKDQGAFFAALKKTAIVFQTFDGGKKWTKKEFGVGYVSEIYLYGKQIFIIKNDSGYKPFEMYSSLDYGKTWSTTFLPNNTINLVHNNKYLFAITSDKRNITGIKFYNNNSWNDFDTCEFSAGDNMLLNDTLYFHQNISGQNLVYKYNISDKTYEKYALDGTFKYYMFGANDNHPALLGLENNDVVCYKLNDSRFVKILELKNLGEGIFPEYYFSKNGKDVFVYGMKDNIGVNYKMLKKNKNNSNWESLNFKNPYYIYPYIFFSEGNRNVFGVFYSGSGKINFLKI